MIGLLSRIRCVLKHHGHLWMMPAWGLDGAILRCAHCHHTRVVRYDDGYRGVPVRHRVAR